ERNRLSMLLAEYTDDIVVSQNAYTIKSRKDSLWFLATKLLSAFDHSNSTTHYLFEDAPEISENRIKDILALYERVQQGPSTSEQILSSEVSRQHHTTTEAEKTILAQLWESDEKLTDAIIMNIVSRLNTVSS
ncbi:13187_t:CDS:2, partial [Racocetra fulgida]